MTFAAWESKMNHQREAVARAKGGVASAASAHAAAAAELEETGSRHSTASADYALEVDRLAQLSGAYVDQYSPISPPYDPQAYYGEPDDEPLHEEQRSWRRRRRRETIILFYFYPPPHTTYPRESGVELELSKKYRLRSPPAPSVPSQPLSTTLLHAPSSLSGRFPTVPPAPATTPLTPVYSRPISTPLLRHPHFTLAAPFPMLLFSRLRVWLSSRWGGWVNGGA
jgi:hypothetical protein